MHTPQAHRAFNGMQNSCGITGCNRIIIEILLENTSVNTTKIMIISMKKSLILITNIKKKDTPYVRKLMSYLMRIIIHHTINNPEQMTSHGVVGIKRPLLISWVLCSGCKRLGNSPST